MRRKSRISVKAKPAKLVTFKVLVNHAYGPFADQLQLNSVKKTIVQKVKHVKFTGTTRNKRGMFFGSVTSYSMKLPENVSSSALKNHIETQSPGAKIEVSKVR